jgi:Rrf2 family nitric oxide-sensitive transcriptional repressor
MRGQRGGLRLGRPATEISIGAVVRRAEPDLHLAPCFGEPNCCTIQADCVLANVLAEALAAFLSVLDRYTLADLVARPAGLCGLLGIQLGDLRVPERPVAPG